MIAQRPRSGRYKSETPLIVKAKLSPPNLGNQVLERPRLTQALNENAQRPLTLLVADAGYGKTTLLAAFLRGQRRPVVWYSLMPSDADLVVFGRHLLEGFRRRAPRFGRSFRSALNETRAGGRSAEMLGSTLANDLASLKGPPYLLVLDDFQEVAESGPVVTLVDTLLRNLPDSLRVVVASRSLPPLSVERLRAKGELFELNSSHLRLTREELTRLFSEVYQEPLAEPDLSALEETTLGWPTAVHLIHESLERSTRPALRDVLADFRASNLELHDYLSTEVFTRLDPESRHLLERTAPLSRFDAPLAAELSGRREARSLLAGLVRRGLLRTFGTGEDASYECHGLVRRFLRQELTAREGDGAWPALEAETAEALLTRGESERALRHFLLADRWDEAVRILHALAQQMLRQGRAAALLGYLNDLPGDLLDNDNMLRVALADAHQALGDWDRADGLYQAALESCRESGDRELECRAMLGLGKVLNLRGRYEQVLGMAERGLALSHDMGHEIRARLLQMKAGAHFYLGQYSAAVQVLDQVRSLLPPAADPELVVPTVHNLATALGAQGKFREAAEEFRAALAQVRGSDSPRAPLYLSNLAFSLFELGELPEARRAAAEGLVAAQRFSNRAQEAMCHAALAQILAQTGDLEGALSALRSAEELNAELRMAVIAADLLAIRGRIFCARGQYLRAVEFITQAIERLAERPGDPRLIEFEATLSWCEMRAGRPRVARDRLAALVKRADAEENDYQKMRVHYWLAECLLALGEKRTAAPHLTRALKLVRERGYLYFLKVQAREEPAPALFALERGIEVGSAVAALVEAGAKIEDRLLDMVGSLPPVQAEAAIAVLAEVGGSSTAERLRAVAKSRRALRPAVQTALDHIAEQAGRGAQVETQREAPAPRLALFGPPHLLVESRMVPASSWRTQRAFQLFVYLALHPRGANREELLELFWPGRRLAEGRRNFHPTLSYIRHVLPQVGPAPILLEGSFYKMNPAYPLTCDAWEFERAVADSHRGRGAQEKRGALERAVAVASGEFLEGVYGDWATERQARMREQLEKVRLELGDLCARAQDFETALGHFRSAAAIDEYREGTRLAVMECLVRLGNRRAALVEFEKLKTLLRTELGVEPLPTTDEAVRRLLAGQPLHPWGGDKTEELPQTKSRQSITAIPQAGIKRHGPS